MTQIAILANSKRPDGQCLAGIDLETGRWVRPVPNSGDGIPVQRCFVNRRFIALRDILELDLIQPRAIVEFQAENQTIRNWNWRVNGRMSMSALEDFIDDSAPVLHTHNDRVAPSVLRALPPAEWKSLQLIRPRQLEFARHFHEENRWVAEFKDAAGNLYSLRITDPIITRRLEAGEKITQDCLLTVSLTKPWTNDPNVRPPMCYKLVAAVMEL
jgi:putative nucleic acid modification protein with dual OB domain